MNHDDRIRNLVAVLDEVYSFFEDAYALKDVSESQQANVLMDITRKQLEILETILKQTSECAQYIIDCANSGSFCMCLFCFMNWPLYYFLPSEESCEEYCSRSR